MLYRILYAALALGSCAQLSQCQVAATEDSTPAPRQNKRILGIIPNYRTYPSLQNYVPLTAREKFKIASEDSLDRGTIAMAALFGAEGQWTNANRCFRARRRGICKVLWRVVRRSGNWRLHDRGDLPRLAASGSSLLPARHRNRMVKGSLRSSSDLLDPSRFRRYTIQLFGDHRKLYGRGNLECVLSGQPYCR